MVVQSQPSEVFAGCNDVKHRQVLFLPSVQCQRESFVPDRVGGIERKFPVKILSRQFLGHAEEWIVLFSLQVAVKIKSD